MSIYFEGDDPTLALDRFEDRIAAADAVATAVRAAGEKPFQQNMLPVLASMIASLRDDWSELRDVVRPRLEVAP